MWMLVVILVASNVGGVHTSITNIQFQTQDACTTAERKLAQESGGAIGTNFAVRTSCVKTN
jgi:hypothetical protein